MTARKLLAPCTNRRTFLALCLPALVSGCAGMRRNHEARRIPHPGVIDPEQARELEKMTMPPYVVEPPDELEVSIKPTPPDWALTTVTVQPDGLIDLGFLGDVYVVGSTLQEIEQRIAAQLDQSALQNGRKPDEPYRVSVRLANAQSKFYYVMGAVQTQGRFPVRGSDTVLDAILLAGLKSNSLPEKAYLVRPHQPGDYNRILKIDWCGIRERGDTLTNYQVFPGDRIIVPGTKPPSLIGTLLGR